MASKTVKTMEAQKSNIVLPVSIQPTAWRLEIDEFLADTKMTNLFLLALEKMQKDGLGMLDAKELEMKKADLGPLEDKDKVNWWTFYNLSGIHSNPLEHWNGVSDRLPNEYTTKIEKDKNYCRHGSIVFPTWHRAYIYQFEQAVSNQMRILAEQFEKVDKNEKVKYRNAAMRFRLPYWDPFMPRNKLQQDKPEDNPKDEPKKKPKANAQFWGLPKILSEAEVWVRRPGDPNKLEKAANPLAYFTFPSDTDYEGTGRLKIEWEKIKLEPKPGLDRNIKITTVRCPGPDGKTKSATLEDKIRAQAQNSATKVWHMLNPDVEGSPDSKKEDLDPETLHKTDAARNRIRTWETFSNHEASNWNSVVSIEAWHDHVHGLVGSGKGTSGHMAHPEVAGFDPIFWLHHCNIDRLFALFQALYPDRFVAEKGVVNIDSELYPFFKSSKDFYTSNDVRDWKKAGFAMPGSADLDDESREIIKEYVRNNYYWATDGSRPPESLKYPIILTNVEAIYGPDAGRAANKLTYDTLEKGRLVEKAVTLNEALEVTTTLKDTAAVAAEQVKNEKHMPDGALQDVTAPTPTKMVTWNALVKVKKHAFNGSFAIHFFIGRVNDQDPGNFMTRPNEVGFSGIFATTAEAVCANCDEQRARNFMYEDVIPVTSTLVDYLDDNPISKGLIQEGTIKTIPNLEPANVEPFLKEHLKWRIVDTASNLMNSEQQIKDSGLEVKVVSRMFQTPNEENKLGVYSDPVLYKGITELKPGGYGYVWQ